MSQCDTMRCNGQGHTHIYQTQVDGSMGWTVLCARHGSKRGYFTRDAVTRKLVAMSRWRALVRGM